MGQLTRTAHEVSVDVRLENVSDRHMVLACQLAIDFHVRPRVDHRCRSRSRITKEVRNLGDPLGQYRFEDKCHGRTSPSVRARCPRSPEKYLQTPCQSHSATRPS